MTLPTVTRAQLEPLLERLLRSTDDDAPIMLVRGNPDHAPEAITVAGRAVEIMASSSPLEIRARASKPRSGPLAVLTGCDNAVLGDDLVARAVRRKVYTVDRWQTVSHLFGADRVSRALSEHSEIADALIESKPVNGYRPVTTKVLDLDTALASLTRVLLGLRTDTLVDVLVWAETPDAARAMRSSSATVLRHVEDHLIAQLGPGVAVAFAALRTESAVDLTAIALTAGVIHDEEASLADALVRLEKLGDPGLVPEAYRSLARAAEERVRSTPPDRAPVAHWVATADGLLATLGASQNAWRSDIVPSGFDQRLALVADAIEQWRVAPDDKQLEAAIAEALELAGRHHMAQETPHRVERLEMAARIVRRISTDCPVPRTLGETIGSYITDGAWYDRARVLVSQGDTEPSVRTLCDTLTGEADQLVSETGEVFARHLSAAAHHVGDHEIGVEHILDQIASPVAAEVPTLVLVLDGMGWPSFLDVLERLERQGWQTLRPTTASQATAALATLPTVTELSRTTLLCGTLRSGDKESERRAFAALPSLTGVSTKTRPPKLFHKTDLRVGGLDTLPDGVLNTILDEANQVVGLVINNIDERLKDVAAPPGGWGLDELAPLREVLDAARRAGRAIVITADHGHVLERHTEHRSGGGGERWRGTDTGPVGKGEIEVRGPRVLTDDGSAILPWAEKLRYGPLRNGYHGGITPAEVIVPVVVMATEIVDGWDLTVIAPPAWWYPTVSEPSPTMSPQTSPSRAKTKRKSQPKTPTLFEVEPVSTPRPSVSRPDPIGRIMTSDHVDGQLAALRLDAVQVAAVLRLLDAAGTAMGEERVADHVGLPRMRMTRLVSQLQRLLNIDGYSVIESGNGEIRFHRALLETQLGLG